MDGVWRAQDGDLGPMEDILRHWDVAIFLRHFPWGFLVSGHEKSVLMGLKRDFMRFHGIDRGRYIYIINIIIITIIMIIYIYNYRYINNYIYIVVYNQIHTIWVCLKMGRSPQIAIFVKP
jgi:hypothetical protein